MIGEAALGADRSTGDGGVARPASTAELLRWIQAQPGPFTLVGGGTVLQPRVEASDASRLIDLTGLHATQGIQALAQGGLRIGAAVRIETLRTDGRVQAVVPLLAQACRTLGGLAVRHLATLGGNIGWRFGDTLAALLVLDAQAEVLSVDAPLASVSCLPLADCLAMPRLPPVLAVRIAPQSGTAMFEKVGWRAAFSPARLSIALAAPVRDDPHRSQPWRIAAGAAGLATRRCARAEALCAGRAMVERAIDECMAGSGQPESRCAFDAGWLASLREACLADLDGNRIVARLAARWLAGQFGALPRVDVLAMPTPAEVDA